MALHCCRPSSKLHSRSAPPPRYNNVAFPHTSSATLKSSESFKTTMIKGIRVQPTIFLSRVPPFTPCIRTTNVSHAQFKVPQVARQRGQECTSFCSSVFPIAGALAASNITCFLPHHGANHPQRSHGHTACISAHVCAPCTVVAQKALALKVKLLALHQQTRERNTFALLTAILVAILGSFYHNGTLLNDKMHTLTSANQAFVFCPSR